MSAADYPYKELLLGCGRRREKMFAPLGRENLDPQTGKFRWHCLITLDHNETVRPDILCDLNAIPWTPLEWFQRPGQPFKVESLFQHGIEFRNNTFDEIHAYEVFEHLGSQGDAEAFFAHFYEVWRLLKPGGYFYATVPSRYSPWLWGDPSHRRAILPESLVFLDQRQYRAQCDIPNPTPMSDFRPIWKGDFDVLDKRDNQSMFWFALQAIKPARLKK